MWWMPSSFMAPRLRWRANPQAGLAGARVSGRLGADEEVEAVGDRHLAARGAADVGAAVLPDNPLALRVDQREPVAVVVVDADQAVREPLGKARVVEHALAGCRVVGPDDRALARELVHPTGTRVVGHEVQIRAELLGVGRIRDLRQMARPHELAGKGVLGYEAAV